MFSSGKSNFERLIDAATSPMLLEPSWESNLELCDSIRQGDVTPKYAVGAIQKRIKDPRPLVSKYALVVLETCVKNCGQPFHEEICNHDLLEDMKNLARSGSAPVKEQVLQMLQAWNHAFRNKTHFQPILATYNLLKMEGFKFPPLSESDAMFSADAAPVWKEGDVCHMCRVKFSLTTRQHHCRACGEVFCKRCSSKVSIIPKIGIEREVRVCDHCYDEINPDAGEKTDGKETTSADDDSELPTEYLNSALSKEAQTKPKLSEEEVKAQEEEEMQLALALSLSEEEANKSSSGKNWASPSQLPASKSQPEKAYPEIKGVLKSSSETKPTLFSNTTASLQSIQNENSSSELSKYLDRSYWEKKNAENKTREPTAPVARDSAQPSATPNGGHYYESDGGATHKVQGEEEQNSDAFVQTMEKSIEMFVDRMNNVRYKGKHIAMDSTVQSLFQSLSAMHPQLIKLIEDEEESKAKYEAMLQKLAVIREARESLNDMRAQHREKMRHQELEQEMLRRMQMEQKLELMRQQKQEYLEYQRQLQIQRQQELEIYQQEKLMGRQMAQQMPGYYPVKSVPQSVASSYDQGPYSQLPSVQKDPYGRPPQYPGHAHQYLPKESTSDTSIDANIVPPPSYDHATAGKPSYNQVAIVSSAAGGYYQNQPQQSPHPYQGQTSTSLPGAVQNSPQHLSHPQVGSAVKQSMLNQQGRLSGAHIPQGYLSSEPPQTSVNQVTPPQYQPTHPGTYPPPKQNSNQISGQTYGTQQQVGATPQNQQMSQQKPLVQSDQHFPQANLNQQFTSNQFNQRPVNQPTALVPHPKRQDNGQPTELQHVPQNNQQLNEPQTHSMQNPQQSIFQQPQSMQQPNQPPMQQPSYQNQQQSQSQAQSSYQNQQPVQPPAQPSYQNQQPGQPPVQPSYQNHQPGQPPVQQTYSSQQQAGQLQPPHQVQQLNQPPSQPAYQNQRPTQQSYQSPSSAPQQPVVLPQQTQTQQTGQYQPANQVMQPQPNIPPQPPNEQHFQPQNSQQQNLVNDPNQYYQQHQQQNQYFNQAPPQSSQQYHQPQSFSSPPQQPPLQPQQPPAEELSENMKDLQLISF